MKNINLNVIALSVALAFSTGAIAENMSKADHSAAGDKIAAEYKTAKANCGSLSGNAADICVAEAKGKEKIALAELESTYKPSSKSRYEARVAKADADYGVAKQRCDDLAGNTKDVCVKEAKAAETAAKADAKAQMKTSDANAKANAKTVDARSDAAAKTADARKDAAVDKNDAQYAVAKEKCDTFAGGAKDRCLDQAKITYVK